jgi:hypothetical protein
VILDNSFISLAENAARAELARSRVQAPLARDLLERYCRSHLGPGGSLLELLSNASVIALPKIAEAQALVRKLYDCVGLSDAERQAVAAQAQRDRVLLRAVLRPGEYLAPRDLLGGHGADHSSRQRFFHGTDFPDRERLLDLYGIGRANDARYGLDVVYFRPRRPTGAAEGPVLRVELNRQLSRDLELLETVLRTLELAGDNEHPEPMPQLLADQIAKSSVASVLEALIESSLIDLIDDADADAAGLEVIRWLYEEGRS